MRKPQQTEPHGPAGRGRARDWNRQETETIHLRNYDLQSAYDVKVEILTGSDTVFENRYFLQPGQTESEMGAVPSGTYEIKITLDNSEHETRECRLDSSADHTVVVEVGNGTFAVTQGLLD